MTLRLRTGASRAKYRRPHERGSRARLDAEPPRARESAGSARPLRPGRRRRRRARRRTPLEDRALEEAPADRRRGDRRRDRERQGDQRRLLRAGGRRGEADQLDRQDEVAQVDAVRPAAQRVRHAVDRPARHAAGGPLPGQRGGDKAAREEHDRETVGDVAIGRDPRDEDEAQRPKRRAGRAAARGREGAAPEPARAPPAPGPGRTPTAPRAGSSRTRLSARGSAARSRGSGRRPEPRAPPSRAAAPSGRAAPRAAPVPAAAAPGRTPPRCPASRPARSPTR